MPRYRLAEPALLDLDDIRTFIAHADERAAERIMAEFEAALRGLAESPGKGHSRTDLTRESGILFWPVRHFLVVYRSGTNPLEVLRVLHGRRNVMRELERD